MTSTNGFVSQEAFHELVESAVARIVATEDLGEFLGWFGDLVYRRCLLERVPVDADTARVLGLHLGRSIWGAVPAPHNDFNPTPLPTPGRNQPCFCGSGLKYKRCCAAAPRMPTLHSTDMWPMVLAAVPAQRRKALVASGRIPVDSLILAAEEAEAVVRPQTAVSFLEPLFGTKIAGKDERYEHALTLLCDLYDELGWSRKKVALLERIRSRAPRSPLRSGAFQRTASIRMDLGDPSGAWDAFRAAQRDAPNDPMIGVLEVQLLLHENRVEAARERARFWRKRLMRFNDESLEGPIEFLNGVSEDPREALAGALVGAVGGAGQRLLEALRDLGERPVPRYELVSDAARGRDANPEAAIARQLRGMGLPADDIDTTAAQLLEQMQDREPGPAPVDEVPASAGKESDARFALVASKALQVVEADWHAIYPVGKPFSIGDVPHAPAYPWDPDTEERWMAFLDRHPEAFDSIDILDDLATAIEVHPAGDSSGLRASMQCRLVERGVEILRLTTRDADTHGDWTLPWTDVGNRPALRCLSRAQVLAEERGDNATARAYAEWLLDLNPGDNHGVRTSLMNIYLRTGDNEAAVALASRFADDMFAELRYGRVLALVRTGDREMAAQAARYAVDALPEVRRYLMRERVRKPRLDPIGVAVGGKEQAWLYRDEMRDLWLSEPEAMALIRRTRPSNAARDS